MSTDRRGSKDSGTGSGKKHASFKKSSNTSESDTALNFHSRRESRYDRKRSSSVGSVKSLGAGATDIENTSLDPQRDGSSEWAGTELEVNINTINAKQKQIEIVLEPAESIKHWKRQKPAKKKYGYFSLFRFSEPLDKLYISIGLIAAIAGGFCIPLMIYVFGWTVRAMVLVFRISHSMDCSKPGYKEDTNILGNTTTCQRFFNECMIQRPFGNKSLGKARLNEVTYETMYTFAIWYSTMAAIFTVCSSIYFMCWHLAGDNQIIRIRKKYFEALLRKDTTWFDTQQNPDAVNKLMDHTNWIWIGIGENIPIAINIFVTALVSLFVAFSHGWQLTALALIAVVTLVFTNWLVSWSNANKLVSELQAYKTANSFAEEILTNIRTVVFYGGQKKEFYRYHKQLGINSGLVTKWILCHSASVFLLWALNFLMWAIIIWFALALVIHDHSCKYKTNYLEIDAGDAIIIILCVVFGVGNIYMVLPVLSAIQVAKDYGQKVFKVIDRKSLIDGMDDEDGMQIPGDEFLGGIEFDDVRFTYPNSKGDIILNRLNLKVLPCSKVAVMGLNGGGKSTILKLICKEYLPDSGFIKIDGVDIRDLNTKWLRAQISVVPQKAELFDDTIEANVRMGKIDAAFPEILAACQIANAHSFIMSFKEGYQTKIGSADGQKLSWGQEQRLAIARALLRNPKILLLDEPTTNLDTETAAMVLDTLKRVAEDRTVILVTHRLHLVTDLDCVFVIKKGKVAEKGVHSQLVKSHGPYRQLATGDIDKPSTSVGPTVGLKAFDVSDTSAIHFMNVFATKTFLPNIYADLVNVDPVGIRCSSLLMKNVVLRQGAPTQLKNSIEEADEEEDVHYALELKDSIVADDSLLSNSECMFKTKPENPYTKHKDIKSRNAKSKVEGLTDIMNPTRYSFSQVFWLTTKSTYKVPILISIIAAIALGLVLPFFGVLFSYAIGIMSDASAVPLEWKWAKDLGDGNYYKWIIICFAFLGLIAGVAACCQEFFLSLASYSMVTHLRKKIFAAILKQDLSFFENPANSVASLREMLASSVLALRYLLYGFYGNFVQGFVIVLAAMIISFLGFHAKMLTGYAVAIAVGVSALISLDAWLDKKQQLTTVRSLTEISELILQVFSGKQQVSIMQLEPYFLDKFNTVQIEAIRLRRRISYVRAFTFGLSQTAVFWGFSLYMYLTANEIVNNGITFTTAIAISEMLIFGTITVGKNFATLPSFRLSVQAGESILGVLNREPLITSYGGDQVEPGVSGKLGFHDVHFWYPFSGETPFLKGINFHIPSGKTVAFVGSSESGKTAFVDLIVKFFNVTTGVLTLDGNELRDLNAVSLRQQMGYVDKLPQLFNRTVAENIAYGDNVNVVTMSRIVEVAKKLQMHNFFCSLPDGYETVVGGGLDRLSSAQKHRIMIARAMLRNPKILLIDEAQTSLDRDGEHLVREAIEVARQGRTTIIIAHRLSSILHVDLIVVMNDGFKVEMGTHAELMKIRHGEYGKLWRSQNPLDDEGFVQGESWLGVAISGPQVSIKPVLHTSTGSTLHVPDATNSKQDEEKKRREGSGWLDGLFSSSHEK